MEFVTIDCLSLEQSKGQYKNILVKNDYFTRFAKTIPFKNQTAQANS